VSEGRERFKEFRKDGWPLCPRCGDDELYSTVCLYWSRLDRPPTLEECFASTFGCYYCLWKG